MNNFQVDLNRFEQLLKATNLDEAEQLIDAFASQKRNVLARKWGLSDSAAEFNISAFYVNIGINWFTLLGRQLAGDGGWLQIVQMAESPDPTRIARIIGENMERCFEKGFDIFDIAAEDVMFLPSDNSPYNINFVFLLGGLGISKYLVGKPNESRKYMYLSLRVAVEDTAAQKWLAEVSHFLRCLNQQPVQIVLGACSITPNIFNPKLLRVSGKLLEWDEYYKPPQDEFFILLTNDDIDLLESLGYRRPIDLEGRTLMLKSDASGNLNLPLSITRVL